MAAASEGTTGLVSHGRTARSPRILVVKLSSLGDLFHPLPAVHALKIGLGATVDWVTHTPYADLVQCFADVDRVLTWPRRAGIRPLVDALRELRAARYDLVLDFQGILKSAAVARLARAARRIGPSFHREGAWLLYSAVAGPRNKRRHAVEECLDAVRHLGLPPGEPVFPLAFPPPSPGAPAPRVALAPFSRWPSKNWPAGAFAAVGRDLREQFEASLFLVGSAAESTACARLAQECSASGGKGRVVNLAGRMSLPELGGLLQAMDLVITNDSGPMHMAAAAGTPVLAVFGPTDPLRTGPFGPGHRVLAGRLRCQPCFAKTCRFHDGACLRVVTPEQVAAAAANMLRMRRDALQKGGTPPQ